MNLKLKNNILKGGNNRELTTTFTWVVQNEDQMFDKKEYTIAKL